MRLSRFLATALLSGLLLAPSASADTDVYDLVLARDDCGGTDNLRLDLYPGASTLGCGNLLGVFGGAVSTYPAVPEALPVQLDGERPIHVAISLGSYTGVVIGGVGSETVEVWVSGKRQGKVVDLGSASLTTPALTMLTQATYVAELEVPLTPEKSGTYTALDLDLKVGGAALSGFVDHDGRSFVSLPVVDGSIPTQDEEE